ncbi:Mbov_0397 family ICE element conjugal transfer ATPase [Spiroplasma sp. DGKH1]|uniref:Mbov_0397 family ICE element conjugal transfer ATPase n=1 Tax=Spiroplasma sp. DGKH1 TaxID=3050074 RepID=UPI0034C66E24
MDNLIPKNVRKTKLEFWRGIGLVEILIIIMWISLSTLFIIGLPISKMVKISCCILFAILAIPLLLPIMPGVKGWYALFLMFKFFAQKKHYRKDSPQNNTGFLVPYDCIVDENYIKTQKVNGKNHFIAGFEIKGYNITLLNPEVQDLKIKELQATFKLFDFSFSIVKVDLPISFADTIEFYEETVRQIRENINNNYSPKGLNARLFENQSYIRHMKNDTLTADNEIQTKKVFYLYVYADKIQKLHEYIEVIKAKLELNNFKVVPLAGYDLVNSIKLVFNPYGEKISKAEYEKHQDSLENLLAFNEFQIRRNYFKADNVYSSVFGVYDYPIFARYGWGASLANNEQAIIWNISPLDSARIKRALNKAVNNARTKAMMTKSNVDRSEQAYEINAYEDLIEAITGANEVVKNVDILFLNYGLNMKLLHESEARLKRSLKELDIKVNPLAYRQLEGYSAFLPKAFDPLMEQSGREMPCLTLASSFPFINGGLDDEQGLYLGQNSTNDVIVFDQFKLTDKRKNHNKIIIGTSGSGKSYTTKKEIAFHLNMGRTVIAIDPEREYKDLCLFYDGQWVDTGDATVGRINPLQVLDNSFRDDNDDINTIIDAVEKELDEEKAAPISNHLRLLDQWFKTLYKELTERERRLLINQIQKTYQRFNINNQTEISKLKNTEFPTFSDLYETICQSIADHDDPILGNLKELIYYDFMGDGQYATLWNGPTTLNLNSNFIVYDVWTLFDQDIQKVTSAQLYLILAFVKGEVKRNRFEKNNKIVVVIDEAHLAIDKDNPVALNFMYQMVKRIRKYNGAMIITTQNWNDFTGTEEIKKKTTAMINNTQYSMIMNLAPSDLKEVEEVYHAYGGLSTEEQEYIARASKGQMLFIVSGYERHCLKIDVSEAEALAFVNGIIPANEHIENINHEHDVLFVDDSLKKYLGSKPTSNLK